MKRRTSGLAVDERDELHVSDDRRDRRDQFAAARLRHRPTEEPTTAAATGGGRDAAPEPGAAPEPASSDGGRPNSRSSTRACIRGGGAAGAKAASSAGESACQRATSAAKAGSAAIAGGAGGLLGRIEQPQHELGGQRGVRIVGQVVEEARVAHGSRHFLSAISARRSQVRMVLSGTSKARASSS